VQVRDVYDITQQYLARSHSCQRLFAVSQNY